MSTADPDDRSNGSVLLLMPAAVLIVVVLGAIALDCSTVFLAHRALLTAAAAAADDAVTFGADERAYRERGVYTLDPARVQEAVELSFAARGLGDAVDRPVVSIDGTTVSVTVT